MPSTAPVSGSMTRQKPPLMTSNLAMPSSRVFSAYIWMVESMVVWTL